MSTTLLYDLKRCSRLILLILWSQWFEESRFICRNRTTPKCLKCKNRVCYPVCFMFIRYHQVTQIWYFTPALLPDLLGINPNRRGVHFYRQLNINCELNIHEGEHRKEWTLIYVAELFVFLLSDTQEAASIGALSREKTVFTYFSLMVIEAKLLLWKDTGFRLHHMALRGVHHYSL